MNWFKKNKQPKEQYLFYKEIEHKGNTICLWAKECKSGYHGWDQKFAFETGWFIKGGYGNYNTGVSPENLQEQMERNLGYAKDYINYNINKPAMIAEALRAVEDIKI